MFVGFVMNMSVHALYGAANALHWNSSKRQNSVHLTLLKHQNTKTSQYKVSKNHWVFALFKIFGSARKKLQSTVSLDHPVVEISGDVTDAGRDKQQVKIELLSF